MLHLFPLPGVRQLDSHLLLERVVRIFVMGATENGAVRPKDSGQARLEELGYKQKLNRDLG